MKDRYSKLMERYPNMSRTMGPACRDVRPCRTLRHFHPPKKDRYSKLMERYPNMSRTMGPACRDVRPCRTLRHFHPPNDDRSGRCWQKTLESHQASYLRCCGRKSPSHELWLEKSHSEPIASSKASDDASNISSKSIWRFTRPCSNTYLMMDSNSFRLASAPYFQ